MSMETWKQEFYPVEANSDEAQARPVTHSLRKWIGLRQENLNRHGLYLDGIDVYEKEKDRDNLDEEPDLVVGATSCALCQGPMISLLDLALRAYPNL